MQNLPVRRPEDVAPVNRLRDTWTFENAEFYLDWKGKLEVSVAQSALDILQYFISSSVPKTKASRLTFWQRSDYIFVPDCTETSEEVWSLTVRAASSSNSSPQTHCFFVGLFFWKPYFFEVYFWRYQKLPAVLRFLVQCLFVCLFSCAPKSITPLGFQKENYPGCTMWLS